MKAKIPVVAAALGLLAGALCPTYAVSFYRIAELGTLGGRESRAFAINDRGEVTGESMTADGETHAFRWDSTEGMIDLGTLGGRTSRGYGINEQGWVVGESESESAERQAFLWKPGVAMESLRLPIDADSGYAYAISETGHIVGAVDRGGGDQAVLWTDILDRPQPVASTSGVSIAYDMNERGAIVGLGAMGTEKDAVSRAFIFESGIARGLADLPDGMGSAARAVSDSGFVAGQVDLGRGITHAFRYDATNGIKDIDTRNNVFSSAYGLNERGEVVGTFFASPSDDDQAFLYTSGAMYNLNDLLDTSDDWILIEAWDINNDGQIVGYGLKEGQERAFLLTPLGESPASSLPVVAITKPARGTSFTEPATLVIEASAESSAGIRRVAFYANAGVIGIATGKPYAITWTNVAAGDYDVSARAFDGEGRMGVSIRERVTVDLHPNKPPQITFMRPLESADAKVGQVLAINAQAEDDDGQVSGMSVYVDGRSIYAEEADSISTEWVVQGGVHVITVEVTDDRGGITVSDPVQITAECAPPGEPAKGEDEL